MHVFEALPYLVEYASLQGHSFLDGIHALLHTLPGPEHLPANSPPASKMCCLIREESLPDQDSYCEMQEQAESAQADQNVSTAVTSAC